MWLLAACNQAVAFFLLRACPVAIAVHDQSTRIRLILLPETGPNLCVLVPSTGARLPGDIGVCWKQGKLERI